MESIVLRILQASLGITEGLSDQEGQKKGKDVGISLILGTALRGVILGF